MAKDTTIQHVLRLFRVRFLWVILFPGFVIQPLLGQSLKREFRGVWVSTVANIDWPSKPGLSVEMQQEEILRILDLHKRNGVNAVILQVRPSADAIYPSELEPWSRFLTGVQGKAPEPYYDPLKYWISEAHSRGMELHAWFNPYRIKLNAGDSLSETHVIHQHPQWSFTYGSKEYFSPANPEVWDFVTRVVLDVVSRYDVDAVHFDDYFYPYKIRGEVLPDSLDFARFGEGFYPDSIDAWRRHNVDTIIKVLGHAIKAEKPWVKFGISPFGVWRNRSDDPMGSESRAGTTNYDGLYADVISWQRKGWIDYMMPQLYWRDDHPAADFTTLAYWWNDFGYGRSVYVGLAPYRIDRKSDHKLWRKEKYFLQQIDVIRSLEGLEGFGYFSSKHFFKKEMESLNKKLQNRYCKRPSIVPSMPWIDAIAPEAPFHLRLEGEELAWDVGNDSCEMDSPRFFVVYRFDEGESRFLKNAEHIVEITGSFKLSAGAGLAPGIYRVSALDRLNNESQLSEPFRVQ